MYTWRFIIAEVTKSQSPTPTSSGHDVPEDAESSQKIVADTSTVNYNSVFLLSDISNSGGAM